MVVDEQMVERLGWVLVHSLWQGVAVAAGLAGVLWLMRGGPARVRHGVSCVALAILIGLPVGTYFWLGRSEGEAARVAEGALVRRASQAERLNLDAVWVGPVVGETSDREVVARRSPLGMVVVGWGLGVLLTGVWQAGGFLWLVWLVRRRTEDAGAELVAVLEQMRARMGVGRRVGIRRAGWVDSPCVVGVLRSVVLVPVAVMSGLTPGQVEALIAHELAHVRRWDAVVNLAQNLVQIVMFYHPAAWYVSRCIREEREHCCDEAAAEACGGDRVGYARALVALEEGRGGAAAAWALGTLGGGRGTLVARVRRILGREVGLRERGGAAAAAAAARSITAAMVAVICVAMPLAAVRSSWAQEKTDVEAKSDASKAGMAGAASEVTPEDLKFEADEYRLGPGDLLTVSMTDLAGPGVQSTKSTRVSDKGTISLWIVGPIEVKGLTEAEAERVVAKTYNALIKNPVASVTLAEARGNTFAVIGRGAERPGVYAISTPEFRVLDAMALAGVDARDGDLFILRTGKPQGQGESPKARKIRIPLDQLLAGESKFNVVIRRGDTVIAPTGGGAAAAGRGKAEADLRKEVEELRRMRDELMTEREAVRRQLADALSKADDARKGAAKRDVRVVRLGVGKGVLTLDKRNATWEDVESELKRAVDGGTQVILELSADEDLTLREYNAARARARQLVEKHGLTPGTTLGGGADAAAGSRARGVEYYVGGAVPRPGAYAMGGPVTLKQALVGSGVDIAKSEGMTVSVVRRGKDGMQTEILRAAPVGGLVDKAQETDVPVSAGDMIMVKGAAEK
jgi:protein involved in polysaccharide export with SLBB domain